MPTHAAGRGQPAHGWGGFPWSGRRRRPRPGDKWHLDEVFLTITGARQYLWRAVDQDGNALDILVNPQCDKKAAKKFFRKLLKGCQYVHRVIITDQLKTYGTVRREVLPSVEQMRQRFYTWQDITSLPTAA
jgi:putative transposase